LLTGCANSPTDVVVPSLPDAPAGLKACTAASVPPIPGAAGTMLTKAQAATSLAEQRAIALAKSRCAKSWGAFYDDLKKTMGE